MSNFVFDGAVQVDGRVKQTPHILQTYNGDSDSVYPFFLAVTFFLDSRAVLQLQ